MAERIVFVVEVDGDPVEALVGSREIQAPCAEIDARAVCGEVVEYIPRSELAELQSRYDELLGKAKRAVASERRAELARVEANRLQACGQDERLLGVLASNLTMARAVEAELAFRKLVDSLPAPHEGDGSLHDPLVIAEQMRKFTDGVREVAEDIGGDP